MFNEKEKNCCFTGHRILPKGKKEEIYDKTREVVIALIEKGVKCFLTGGAIGYDALAAQVVLSLKEKYPFIELIAVCPCENQDAKWNESQKQIYKEILNKADMKVVLAESYYDGCMQARNRYMVDNSKYCVCYLRYNGGGTYYTVKYAQKLNKEIISI